MSLLIDFKLLEGIGLNSIDLLYLYYTQNENFESLKKISPLIDIKDLEKKKYIKIDEDGSIHLRQDSINLIESSVLDIKVGTSNNKIIKKSTRLLNTEINEHLTEFREKWSGLKPGAMGSPKSCSAKLLRWMQENPEYSMQDILEAADKYIASLNGDYRFLQRADYFIFKQENHREESSRLSAFIDEPFLTNEDWTTQLK